MRSLAHIEKVKTVYDIENADNIEMVVVQDYHVVAKKGQFKVNDLVVYVEVDSILPDGLPEQNQIIYKELKTKLKELTKRAKKENVEEELANVNTQIASILFTNTLPHFEFLRQKKFTIKALRYNSFNVISQGILFSTDILNTEIIEGKDVTELLQIKKVEEETIVEVEEKQSWLDKKLMRFSFYRSLKRMMKSKIPGKWNPKFPKESDEVKVQAIFSKYKDKYNDREWMKTLKLEGQNIGAYLIKNKILGIFPSYQFGVTSHHRNLITYDGSQFWKTAKKLKLEELLRKNKKQLFLRGEHCGPGIQGNIHNLKEHDIYFFEIFDMAKQRYYTYEEFKTFCLVYDLKMAPVVSEKEKLKETVQEMLDDSNGPDILNPEELREGYIWRLKDEMVSFKCRSPEYLIKHGK